MKNKTILVTGGAGFIGSHLIEELVKNENNKVISLDNYFTGLEDNHIDGAFYVKGETKDIEKLIKEKIDIVYHLGEYSRVMTSFDDIDLLWRLNQKGTFRVLEFARKNKIRLIYAGSSTKFGEFNTDGNGNDQTPYIYFKATNTDLVNNYGKWFDLDYAITYFYNVYGEREIMEGKYATLIGIFLQKYKNKLPLTVNSPGTQKRAFTYVKDTVRGLMLVGEKGKGDGYCIGSLKNYTILEIAKLFGGKVEIFPAVRGDREYSKIDITKMKELGWSADHSIEDYIEEVSKR
jgi:UDP-glucose 4-epimerase